MHYGCNLIKKKAVFKTAFFLIKFEPSCIVDKKIRNFVMTSLLYLIIQIINLFQFVLIIYIILTWLVNFNIINTGNRFIYSILDALYRLCEPSLNFVRRYLPTFGAIDLSPIVVYLGLWFVKSLLIEYWPR